MPTTIRLTLNDQLQSGLNVLQERYPFMKPDEILKLALSKLYEQEKTQTATQVSDKPSISYSQMQEKLLKAPGGIDFKNEQEMTDWWMKIKNDLR